jgi:hypothetical protein
VIPLLVVLAACKPSADKVLVSSDRRIDGADGAVVSEGTRMCSTGAGRVIVVWTDDREQEGHPQVWSNRSDDVGATWAGPVKLSDGEVGAFTPEIACSGDHVYLTWEDTRDGVLENGNIYARSSDDGGATFGDEFALDGDEDGKAMSLEPQVVADGEDAYVVWFDGRSGAYDIYASGSDDGGATWKPAVRVDGGNPGGGYSAHARAAYDGSTLYVAWEDSRTGDHSDIYFAKSDDGAASFSDDVRLDKGDGAGASDSFSPAISAEDGVVYVVWHDQRNGDGADILMNWSGDSGDTFEESAIAVETDNIGFFDSLYPKVLVTGGKGHIVWQDARSAGFDIYYRQADKGKFAADEVRLDTDGAGFGNSLQPVISADGGDLAVLWQDRRADGEGVGYDELYYNFSKDAGASWADKDIRADSIKPGTHWAVDQNAIVQNNRLFAAWTDGRNGDADVYFQNVTLGEEATYIPKDEAPTD